MDKRRNTASAWIYQDRFSKHPICMHVVAQGSAFAPKCSVAIFSDLIPVTGKDDSIYKAIIPNPQTFAYLVANVLDDYGIYYDDDDIEQLYREWYKIVSCL